MANLVVVMQAKKSLYFMPLEGDGPPMPFMIKNDLRIMVGARTMRPGYHYIEHTDENFRFFVPMDMLRVSTSG